MRIRKTMFSTLGLAAMLAAGCGGSPTSSASSSTPSSTPAESSGPVNAGGEMAPRSGDTADATVVCHLDCSGTEASASGATEEEARANVRRFVQPNCRPEDGQYFIFCDPPR